MRTIALTWCFLLLPAPALAQEGCGDGCGCGSGETATEEPEHDISPPADLKAQEIVDKAGNFKIKTLPGWEVVQDPPEEGEEVARLVVARKDTYGNSLVTMRIFREQSSRAETFTIDTPADVLGRYLKGGTFDGVYGQGAGDVLRPRVNEGVQLGGATKSGEYELASLTMEEDKEVREKEALKRRDPKVVVPEFRPRFTRGRIAMVSPFIYLIRTTFAQQLNHRPELADEYRKIMDSFEFLESGELPPPLDVGRLLRLGGSMLVGNTTDDPANGEDRKDTYMHSESALKTYKLKVEFVVPAGFHRLEKLTGGSRSVALVAQDAKNNWVFIEMHHANANRFGEEKKKFRPKKQEYESWKHNWESKARGVKMSDKPSKVSFGGGIRGDGCKLVEGTVENFPGTFTGVVHEKSGWRTLLTMETRGKGHEVFEDQIKLFFKKLKLKKTK